MVSVKPPRYSGDDTCTKEEIEYSSMVNYDINHMPWADFSIKYAFDKDALAIYKRRGHDVLFGSMSNPQKSRSLRKG